MSKDYDSKLQGLKRRRQGGTSGLLAKSDSVALDSAFHVPLEEAYEKRSINKATRYALGALQEVDAQYTKNSYAQGDRVKNQLEKSLLGEIPVEFEYQGSVPLNVHIRGTSDVDLLVLRKGFVTIDISGAKNLRGEYSDWTGESGPQLLLRLRTRSASVLRAAFPEADVDTSGSKSIALSGGSLSRKIDVVPSHWHDTVDYQKTGEKKDREVCILDTSSAQTIKNYPFLHMHHINVKDILANGGAKKMIRLLKTLKVDSDRAALITLNSYDVAGLVWHFRSDALNVQRWNELSLVAVAQTELASFVVDKPRAMQLKTPDGTRCIIDSDEKFTALIFLYIEVNELAEAIAQELIGSAIKVTDEQVSRTLRSTVIA